MRQYSTGTPQQQDRADSCQLELSVGRRVSREFTLLVPNPEAANRRSSAQESQRADECEFCQTNRNQERPRALFTGEIGASAYESCAEFNRFQTTMRSSAAALLLNAKSETLFPRSSPIT